MARIDLAPNSADDFARLALQEANHRLANSLHLVTMMLASEERRVTDATAKTALANARMRLITIARLSRTLCELDKETIELDAFLGEVCDDLADAFLDSSGVQLIANIDNISVLPPIARTLGLVLHELLVNALKHGCQRRIEVMCGTTATGMIELRVVNEASDLTHAHGEPGLGTTIVRSLLHNGGGNYVLEHAGRTVAQVVTLPRCRPECVSAEKSA